MRKPVERSATETRACRAGARTWGGRSGEVGHVLTVVRGGGFGEDLNQGDPEAPHIAALSKLQLFKDLRGTPPQWQLGVGVKRRVVGSVEHFSREPEAMQQGCSTERMCACGGIFSKQ